MAKAKPNAQPIVIQPDWIAQEAQAIVRAFVERPISHRLTYREEALVERIADALHDAFLRGRREGRRGMPGSVDGVVVP